MAGVDNAVWTATLTMPAGTFSGWSSLGGSTQHDPTPAASSATKQDLYVVGADGALWTKTWNGTSWGPTFRTLYGGITSSPEAAAGAAANRSDIFAVGTDGALWQATTTDGGTTYGNGPRSTATSTPAPAPFRRRRARWMSPSRASMGLSG